MATVVSPDRDEGIFALPSKSMLRLLRSGQAKR
jgi:hypothetical protein